MHPAAMSATDRKVIGAALHSLSDDPIVLVAVFAPGSLRRLYLANFVLYLAIFGFFRVYPMYLVNRFHMDVSRESLFVAWVAVPIVAAAADILGGMATFGEANVSNRG